MVKKKKAGSVELIVQGKRSVPVGDAANLIAITSMFLRDVQELWYEMGPDALRRMASETPALFCQMVAKLAQVQRVEIGKPGDFKQARSMDQLMEMVEERAGPKGRELFGKFVQDMEAQKEDEDA